ncbi:MAG TPA: murein biosynthesis integral membrane protein MurJ, partial [Acidimicrobiales bacterium]|nr:murein biosynthesis integral membrane protein MurJ [Acidimicrobiales bacterium]
MSDARIPEVAGPTSPTRPRIARSAGVMAVGTTLSRVTGLLRIVALFYAVGFGTVADAYNLANTVPNIVVDLVLGGVLAATFVPVFVEQLAKKSDREAWDAISAVTTVTVIVIGVASVVFLVAAPPIIEVLTGGNHSADAHLQTHVATELLILFVPQLTCYLLISLATALLNARRIFAAPTFAPIANNVVLIVLLVLFGTIVHHDLTLAELDQNRGWILLLGVGTTLGVVAQMLVMIPSLRRADLRLHWYPYFRHQAVRTIVRLSGWTFGLVVANQLALLVVLRVLAPISGGVSAYTYAYAFFQLPYGIIAVSIVTATAPELAQQWSLGDLPAFRRRLAVSLRAMLAIVVPAGAGMLVLARPLVSLLGHATGHAGATGETGVALSMLALGVPGFCVFVFAIRALQSIQDLRSAFWLYVLENAVNIILAVVLVGPLGVRGVMLSISIAYTVGAAAALARLRTEVGGLGADLVSGPLRRILLATLALVVAATLASNAWGSDSGLALLGRVVAGAVAGAAAYVIAAGLLGVRAERHKARARRRTTLNGQSAPQLEPLPPAGRPPTRPVGLGPT